MITPQPPKLPSAPLLFTTLAQAAPSPSSTFPQFRQENSQLTYNVKTPPDFQQSQELQAIVDEAVSLADAKGLPTNRLSMTLIDARYRKVAGYQQQQLRYPASIVKLFWMVAYYAQIENGVLPESEELKSNLNEMIQHSNNDAASRILDAITNTKSGEELDGEEYQNWLGKRNEVNQFFQAAGYQSININQKVYPIDYLDLNLPEGRDLQMRGYEENPIINHISTEYTARLLYEIFTGQSVSRKASENMARLLTRNLQAETAGKKQPASSEETPREELLFGQSLPPDVYLASKAGWTSNALHSAAFVSTPDGRTAYIIVVFGSDRAYVESEQFFPQLSRLVFERMTHRSENR